MDRVGERSLSPMLAISFRQIIQHVVWLYPRFSLSYRDVEGLLVERELEVSYETIRRWVLKFGPAFARRRGTSRHRQSLRQKFSYAMRSDGQTRYFILRNSP